jgi:hypothetical protein
MQLFTVSRVVDLYSFPDGPANHLRYVQGCESRYDNHLCQVDEEVHWERVEFFVAGLPIAIFCNSTSLMKT